MAARRKNTDNLGSAAFRNKMRLELLIRLPAFQKEVAAIRRDFFNIPSSGIANDEQMANWQRSLDDAERNKEFGNSIEQLGRKFKLPFHFFNLFGGGLRVYVLKNKIIPPLYNFVIEHQPTGRRGKTDYLSIKTFAFLDNEELELAAEDIAELQKHYFPEETLLPVRSRSQFTRDLLVLDKLIKRTVRPTRRKEYLPDSYLDFRTRRASPTAKELAELERKHPNNIVVRYNETISREVAKELGISPNAVRKALSHIRKLAKGWFGVDIGGGQQSP